MAEPVKSPRERHEEFALWLERVRITADWVGDVPIDRLGDLLDEVLAFFTQRLIPRATAEHEFLYPTVDRITGWTTMSETMTRDHREIERLAEELAALRARLAATTPGDRQAKELRRVLYSLFAVAKLHFAEEEDIRAHILERGLSGQQKGQIFREIEDAAERSSEGVEPADFALAR